MNATRINFIDSKKCLRDICLLTIQELALEI
jgi:hypothetical protein